MDRAEYWILAMVVEYRMPLRWLAAPNLGEILNVAETHGLSRPELIDVLNALVSAGDLVIERGGMAGSPEFLVPTPRELDSILTERAGSPRRDAYFGLSERGGGRWEARAAPDWGRYLRHGFNLDSGTGEAEGGTRDLVERWLSAQRDLGDEQPIADSTRWDVLGPWQATYWKSVSMGHRVTFRYRTERRHNPKRAAEWERRRVWWSKALHDYPFRPDHGDEEMRQ